MKDVVERSKIAKKHSEDWPTNGATTKRNSVNKVGHCKREIVSKFFLYFAVFKTHAAF